jgi:cytochrome c peroxidase
MKFNIYTYILFVCLLASCKNEPYEIIPEAESGTFSDVRLEFNVPSNFPPLVYDVDGNPPTEKGFELGRRLFYEGRLASDGVVACGFCHIQEFAFTHHTHIISHGVDGALGSRNAQPLHNLAYQNEFTWDGAAIHLDLQPIIPITSELEMNETFLNVIQKLETHPEYPRMFQEAFENGQINSENILKALSQFMIMMVTSNSKYDKFRRNEGNVTLTENETQGMELFSQKCASCHAGELFTDQSYRNNGLAIDMEYDLLLSWMSADDSSDIAGVYITVSYRGILIHTSTSSLTDFEKRAGTRHGLAVCGLQVGGGSNTILVLIQLLCREEIDPLDTFSAKLYSTTE